MLYFVKFACGVQSTEGYFKVLEMDIGHKTDFKTQQTSEAQQETDFFNFGLSDKEDSEYGNDFEYYRWVFTNLDALNHCCDGVLFDAVILVKCCSFCCANLFCFSD